MNRLLITAVLIFSVINIAGCDQSEKTPEALMHTPPNDGTAETTSDITLSRQNAIVVAAEEVGKSVVTVKTVKTVRRKVFDPFSDFFSDFFREFYWSPPLKEYKQEVPGLGSGFIISDDGYILTAEHVVHGVDSVKVQFSDGSEIPAEFIGSDYYADVAVLKVNKGNLPPARLGNSDSVIVGEWSIAIGHPFAEAVGSPQPSVTVGVISAKGRTMRRVDNTIRISENLIQTDAAINPGNSGGPLVNANGEVIGINTAIITTSGGSLGIGFAVPINTARKVARYIIENHDKRKSWLGVYLIPVTESIAYVMEFKNEGGLLIAEVVVDSPAYNAGLRSGDVIVSFDGKKVHKTEEFDRVVFSHRAGDEVELTIRRAGKKMTGKIRLGSPPEGEAGR